MGLILLLRLVGMITFGIAGGWVGFESISALSRAVPNGIDSRIPSQLSVIFALAGLGLGFILAPYITITPYRWFRSRIREISARYLLAGTIGLGLGLVIAALLALPLSLLPPPFGQVLPVVGAVVFASIGVIVMVTRDRDLFNLINLRRGGRDLVDFADAGELPGYLLLDTSVIIDGRIADISRTGFIERTMLVPQFVLSEVQHFADSPDRLRRNRGQRGLEILNRLQKESPVPVQISDMDVDGVRDVDTKLVRLAKKLQCPIITNDFKLNQVAALQGVRVLNINELANTIKTVVLPGETITVRIIQEGREPGQGVGYLDDGTMIVVEDGRRHISDTLEVMVTRVLQTAAGRMIFAQLEEKAALQRGLR